MEMKFRKGKTVFLDPPPKKKATEKTVEPKDKKDKEGGIKNA